MDKGSTLARTSLFLRVDQLEKLRLISEQTGATIAYMIRRGIDNYLDGQHLPSVRNYAGEVTTDRSR